MVQPSFLTKLVMSSCSPPSDYILVGKSSRLNYTHHNIESKVKLSVCDFNFPMKYKLIIHCEAFGVGGIYFLLKQFWYLFEEKKIKYELGEVDLQKKSYFHFASGVAPYYHISLEQGCIKN